MGAALAREFHKSGLYVIATARNISSMSSLTSLENIELLPLDITSEESIKNCVPKVKHLDILINNAGASYNMPIADISILEAKRLFDINVWGHLAVTQAFLPLLMKSQNAMVVNHTSIGAAMILPFQAAYNASKAAMATFTQTLRLELQAFDIAVVEMKTGGVKTNIMKNTRSRGPTLPEGSIYAPARDAAEKVLSGKWADAHLGMRPEEWAKAATADLLRQPPPQIVWRGDSIWSAWFAGLVPLSWLEGMTKKMTGLGKVEEDIRKG